MAEHCFQVSIPHLLFQRTCSRLEAQTWASVIKVFISCSFGALRAVVMATRLDKTTVLNIICVFIENSIISFFLHNFPAKLIGKLTSVKNVITNFNKGISYYSLFDVFSISNNFC